MGTLTHRLAPPPFSLSLWKTLPPRVIHFYPQVFTAAVSKEEEGSSVLAQKAELEQEFPSLAAAGKATALPFSPSPASGKSDTDGGP